MTLQGKALQALELGLHHPISGEHLLFQAALPVLFEKLLRLLRRHNRDPGTIPFRH